MNKKLNVRLLAYILCSLFLFPSLALGYPFLDEAARAKLKNRGDVILEVGAVPSPPPTSSTSSPPAKSQNPAPTKT